VGIYCPAKNCERKNFITGVPRVATIRAKMAVAQELNHPMFRGKMHGTNMTSKCTWNMVEPRKDGFGTLFCTWT
jgi:hypothetical protein